MPKNVSIPDPAASGEPPVHTSSTQRACLLVNPVSGTSSKDNSENAARAWAALREAGIWSEIIETKPDEDPGAVARRAADAGFSMVIASGGDGTVGATAKGLIDTDCPLGILPMGTYNNFARSLRLPKDLHGACKILSRGRIRRVDVGVANDNHYFFEAAGIGIDAQLFPLGEEIKEGRWGRFLQIAKLAYQAEPARIHFELDLPLSEAYRQEKGEEAHADRSGVSPYAKGRGHELDFSAFLLIVANGRYYGSGFTVAPDAVMDDGLFNIRIFRNFSKRELLKHFWSISRRRYCYSPKIDTFTASAIRISAQTDLPFHVDGYPKGKLPLSLKCRRRALKVLA